MRIEYGNSRSKRDSLVTTFLTVFSVGWIIYFILFFLTDHFGTDVSLNFLLHSNYPARSSDEFRDFFEVNKYAALGTSYISELGECANYPPLALLIAKFFALFTPSAASVDPLVMRDSVGGMILFAVVFSAFVFAIGYFIFDYLKGNLKESKIDRKLALVLTLMLCASYTLLFALERGNYIFAALVAFVVFVFTYRDYKIVSAVALAICACIKVYPVLFFLVFLFDKRYKAFFIGMATGIAGLFLPMLALKGSLFQQLRGFINGVLNFSSTSQATQGEVAFNYLEQHSNSFSNIFRIFPFAIFGKGELSGIPAVITKIFSVASTVSLVLLVVISLISLVAIKNNWKRLFIVFALLCLIPSNTYDYMLTFAIPILVLVLCEGDIKNKKYIVLLTLLACVPKNYLYFGNYYEDVSIQCAINPLIMTVMLVMLFFDSAIPSIKQSIAEKRKKKAAKKVSKKAVAA